MVVWWKLFMPLLTKQRNKQNTQNEVNVAEVSTHHFSILKNHPNLLQHFFFLLSSVEIFRFFDTHQTIIKMSLLYAQLCLIVRKDYLIWFLAASAFVNVLRNALNLNDRRLCVVLPRLHSTQFRKVDKKE